MENNRINTELEWVVSHLGESETYDNGAVKKWSHRKNGMLYVVEKIALGESKINYMTFVVFDDRGVVVAHNFNDMKEMYVETRYHIDYKKFHENSDVYLDNKHLRDVFEEGFRAGWFSNNEHTIKQ